MRHQCVQYFLGLQAVLIHLRGVQGWNNRLHNHTSNCNITCENCNITCEDCGIKCKYYIFSCKITSFHTKITAFDAISHHHIRDNNHQLPNKMDVNDLKRRPYLPSSDDWRIHPTKIGRDARAWGDDVPVTSTITGVLLMNCVYNITNVYSY